MDRYKMLESIDTRRALFGMFFSFGNKLQVAGDNFYDEITVKQFYLLMCLYLFQGQDPTIGELSELMGSSHQNVKQLVNKLERNGFIKTYPDLEDKRKLRVMETEKLGDYSENYKEKGNEFFELFYDGVSDEEIEITYKTVSKIEENLTNISKESNKG